MPVTTYISHGAVALYKDTGIGHTEDDGEHQSSTEITEKAGAWYTLDGVKVNGVGAGPFPSKLAYPQFIVKTKRINTFNTMRRPLCL